MAFPLIAGIILLSVLASDATTLALNRAPGWVRPAVWATALIVAAYLIQTQ